MAAVRMKGKHEGKCLKDKKEYHRKGGLYYLRASWVSGITDRSFFEKVKF